MPQMPIKKFFKIGELVEYSGLSRQTINYYTMLGVIREAGRTKTGYRLYDESVFARLEIIRELKKTKTLKEIAEYFQHEANEPDDKSQ